MDHAHSAHPAQASPAAELGYHAGHADAGWVLDGNTPAHTYHHCLQLDADGDPAWWDHYGPTAAGPLSGQWADAATPATLADDIGLDPTTDPRTPGRSVPRLRNRLPRRVA